MREFVINHRSGYVENGYPHDDDFDDFDAFFDELDYDPNDTIPIPQVLYDSPLAPSQEIVTNRANPEAPANRPEPTSMVFNNAPDGGISHPEVVFVRSF